MFTDSSKNWRWLSRSVTVVSLVFRLIKFTVDTPEMWWYVRKRRQETSFCLHLLLIIALDGIFDWTLHGILSNHRILFSILNTVFLQFVISCQIMEGSCQDWHSIEFFLNNTNLTFLAVLYKIDIEGFQNQQNARNVRFLLFRKNSIGLWALNVNTGIIFTMIWQEMTKYRKSRMRIRVVYKSPIILVCVMYLKILQDLSTITDFLLLCSSSYVCWTIHSYTLVLASNTSSLLIVKASGISSQTN